MHLLKAYDPHNPPKRRPRQWQIHTYTNLKCYENASCDIYLKSMGFQDVKYYIPMWHGGHGHGGHGMEDMYMVDMNMVDMDMVPVDMDMVNIDMGDMDMADMVDMDPISEPRWQRDRVQQCTMQLHAMHAPDPCLPCLGIILRTFLEHLVLFCIIFTFFVIDVNQSMIISHFRTQFDYFHFPPRNFV